MIPRQEEPGRARADKRPGGINPINSANQNGPNRPNLKGLASRLRLAWLDTEEDFARAVTAGLCPLYCKVFGDAYDERFTPQEVQRYFANDLRGPGGRVVVAYDRKSEIVVGFAATTPLARKPDVASLVAPYLSVPVDRCTVLREDAVDENYRRQGLSTWMKRTVFDLSQGEGNVAAITRTSTVKTNPQLRAIFRIPGTVMLRGPSGQPLTQIVDSLRLDGTTRPDERCFFVTFYTSPKMESGR